MARRQRVRSIGVRVVPAFFLDLFMVLTFAAVGRSSHGEADGPVGILGTAWPFAAAAAIGWLITLAGRRSHVLARPYGLGRGVIVLVSTVLFGMVLRLLAGGTAAWPFWIVAFISLGILLLGWRLVIGLLRRQRDQEQPRLHRPQRHRPQQDQPAAAITSSEASKLE
jgi:hypothetical protein